MALPSGSQRDSFSADGVTIAYQLSQVPAPNTAVLVYENGILQGSPAYVVSGQTLVISPALPSGYVVDVVYSPQSPQRDSFVADGLTTTFALSQLPAPGTTIQVYANGLLQALSAYSIVGQKLTIAPALPSGYAVDAVYFVATATLATVGPSQVSAQPQRDFFTADGVTTVFQLSLSPAAGTFVLLYVNGIAQDPSMYVVSGQALTITPALPGPPNPYTITAVYWTAVAAIQTSTDPFTQVTLIITAAQFRRVYREFADTNLYPDSAVNYWLAVASLMLNPCRWDNMLPLGAALYAAHNLVLEVKAQSTALAGGWPGVSKGAITSENAGAVSISYDNSKTLEEDGGHWNLTEYGVRFLRMAKMFGAGPIQIGPCVGAPGSVGFGNAWTGPMIWPW
jgi:hypothetical protein